MTVGQRIACKRKELGLSQEGLGARLGVSRQAIYKWESDAALPEIEKLVKLGREFSVPVGWLLGEEDEAPEQRELTPEQLRMVEEIVGRYLAARPGPEAAPGEEPSGDEAQPAPPKKRRRWPWVLGGAAVIAVALMFSNLFSRLDRLYSDTQNLQMNVGEIRYDVNSQIYSITSRVEEILQSQNTLTAEQGAEVSSTDCRANTITISARALPKTFVEGMTAEFIMVSDGETVTVPGTLGRDHAFTADVTGPLSDDISLTVVFLTGDQRATQLLNQFAGLYSESFPEVSMTSSMLVKYGREIKETAEVFIPLSTDRQMISDLRLGLFRDKKLLAWYARIEGQPDGYAGDWSEWVFFHLDGDWEMEPGYEYCLAAVVTDAYGRELVYPSFPVVYDPDTDFADYPQNIDFQFTASPKEWDY